MSKEIERLNSKIEFYNNIINELVILNFRTNSNKYDKIIEHYQFEVSKIYKRIQELKEEEVK